ncbi:CGNR zinc finger domain-containing protein [Paenibacillus sp. NPDC057967]|uniref:CGNR zinc finger domain-containing protein n=1 Tax=Paenibacillus sp. NPDC057967 TaxID=3346293 RepID=UPI0036DCF318
MDELWTDFANSLWHDWRGDGHSEDRLLKPEWQTALLESWELHAPVPIPAEDMVTIQRFRDRLRQFAIQLSRDTTVTHEMISAVNEKLKQSAATREMRQDDETIRMVWLPQEHTWKSLLSEVAASFAQTLADGQGNRIRICENSNCNWVFLDDTRNRSKRFCDDKMCGNLMKVRRFRERKKSESK